MCMRHHYIGIAQLPLSRTSTADQIRTEMVANSGSEQACKSKNSQPSLQHKPLHISSEGGPSDAIQRVANIVTLGQELSDNLLFCFRESTRLSAKGATVSGAGLRRFECYRG
jgi:hypothetical protein